MNSKLDLTSKSRLLLHAPLKAKRFSRSEEQTGGLEHSRVNCIPGAKMQHSQLSISGGACVWDNSLWSCPTPCDPLDCSPPGSSVVGFSRQEYWTGLPRPPPGDLPDPEIEPASPALAGRFFTTTATWEAPFKRVCFLRWEKVESMMIGQKTELNCIYH